MSHNQASLSGLAPDERRALLARLLREQANATVRKHLPTYGQRALWYIHQLAPESTAYNIGTAAWAHHTIDVPALQRALQMVVARHAALRTTFADEENGPMACVHSHMDVPVEQVDAQGWDDHRLEEAATAALHRPYDLERGPLMRVCLFSRSPTDHLLLTGFFHAISDGWSIGLFLLDLSRHYAAEVGGVSAPPPVAAPQEPDYAAWQADMLAGAEGERLRTFWLERFGGPLPQLELPTDRPRPPTSRFRGAAAPFSVDAETLEALNALAKAERVTLYTLLLAAYQVLLHRYSGQSDLIVGTPLACRAQPQFQRTLGFFANAMPVRSTISGATTFHALLEQARAATLDALAHQDYPFALLVEQLRPQRNANRAPVFEVTFNFMRTQSFAGLASPDASNGAAEGENLHLQLVPKQLAQEAGQFDLAMDIGEHAGTLHGAINYSSDLFDAPTIGRMARHYTQILCAILADPNALVEALPLLTEEERVAIAGWNATAAPYSDVCLHDLVAAQAARTPEAVALRCDRVPLTYGDLDARANLLARRLGALGVQPGTLVGVYMERSLEMIIALLAVLKAGGAYVPLDPGFPAARVALMLEESDAPVVLTQQGLAASLPQFAGQVLCLDGDWPQMTHSDDTTLPEVGVESLAYVIFTSGSTGRPKGVQIPHRAVVNFLESMRTTPGLAAGDVLAAVTTLSFDIAVLELFLPLVTGAECIILNREVASNGNLLAEAITAANVSVMQATPATWRMLLTAGWSAPAGFRAFCGGEALPPALAQALLAAGCELWNMYGPTETTIWSAVQRITDATPPIVIGHPIANTQLHVLNAAMQPNPVGVLGELWIGGNGLAHGYLHRPDLTAERFVTDPFRHAPARLYRTGDVARRRPDGAVEVLGRTDHQVKIRGYRIELGEIEVALTSHPAVRDAVVVAREDGRGAQRLVAYLVAEGEIPQAGALRLHLRASLPDYMIPAAFLTLEALPRTPNGKVDRQALPTPDALHSRRDEQTRPPATATEKAIAAVWNELLGGEQGTVQAGLYDNFFDLGGHSLLAMEALSKLDRMLGAKLNPALLRAQTLGQVAASYDALLSGAPAADAGAVDPEHEHALESGLGGRLLRAVRRAVSPGSAT